MRNFIRLFALLFFSAPASGLARTGPSVARLWDEEILAAIRIDLPNPPVHARNLFHFSIAMYDAWATYDSKAVGYLYHEKEPVQQDMEAARREAISFAAYRVLTNRFSFSVQKATTLPRLENRLRTLGYSPENDSLEGSSPSAIGNRVAALVIAYFMDDGAQQSRGYADIPFNQGGYAAVNPPLVTGSSETFIANINRWQPLIITNAVSQNDIPVDQVQKFVGAQWKAVRPFALHRDYPEDLWFNPGPPPQLGGVGDADFRAQVVEVIRLSSLLDPTGSEMINISPGAMGNNTLGKNDGTGHPVNPITGQPYEPNMVRRGDFGRIMAEFWADGPASETPPGHWNVLANEVSDSPGFQKRIGAVGPIVSALEWDVKLYLALNAGMHDAACAAWSLKRQYDGWRPITVIRAMAQLGQSTDPRGPSFHPLGLPLITNLIEVVTSDTAKAGERHAGMRVGDMLVKSWLGAPPNPASQIGGVGWVKATTWMPYQKATFVTPAFPGYTSGHSTFSRAGAETLAGITGSIFVPGGLGSFHAPANTYLKFERGPSTDVNIQWATYYDAADLAGISRLYGGIHVSADDLNGRVTGSACGKQAWELAQKYFDGSIAETIEPMQLRLVSGYPELKMKLDRGFYYRLQTSEKVDGPYTDAGPGFERAKDSTSFYYGETPAEKGFYRLLKKP